PGSCRVPHPAGRRVRFQLASVDVDNPMCEVVVQKRDGGRRLNDAPPAAKLLGLWSARPALIHRARLVVLELTLARQIEHPRLEVGGLGTADDVLCVPYAGEIRLAVGAA